MDLSLNYLQRLICHKTKLIQNNFSFVFITRNVRMSWVRWRWLHAQRAIYESAVKTFLLFFFLFYFLESYTEPPFGIEQSQVLSATLLSRVSSLFNTGQSGAKPETKATWHLVAAFCKLLFSTRLCTRLYSGHPRKFSRSHFQSFAYALQGRYISF